jgi:asparagine synthase (glutamine-hydrolysing)
VHVSAAQAAEALPRIVWDLDEPIADPACVPLWFLSRRTRQLVTVVLSGEGGDEIFAGYSSYQWMARMERLRALGMGSVAALVAGHLPSERWRRAARMVSLPLEERYRGVSRALDDTGRRLLLGGASDRDAARALQSILEPVWERTRGMTPLRRMLYLDTRVWLPDDLLMKADKMTMATAIELRVPLLDHHLVEHAWSLPDRYKVRRGEGKRLLRRAARGRVPAEILARPKQGFATPTGAWLRAALAPLVEEVLLDGRSLGRERFDRTCLETFMREHRAGRDRSPELWALLVLELWHARMRQVQPLDTAARAQAV